jgi:nitroimidazol reductase NimA-like FMN-containing flavoprotein (pyridoxamine 5'-phosphate oxidase superfamily)
MTVELEHIHVLAQSVPEQWPSAPDPGDLSRRIAHRRAELRLTVGQVAARAQLSRRYVEYLERYPSLPRPATLRSLAAALRTTSAALLGAGMQAPPGQASEPARRITEKLTVADCRRLIEPGGVGRIAVSATSGLTVLPVNFAVVAETIVIRTGSGTLIAAHATDDVAFEVDHVDEALGAGWSVLVRGPARRVAQPAELRRLREHAAVRPWAAGEREVYIRILPVSITGRRVGTS